MITLKETTVWLSSTTPNHQYILSNDKRLMYGYIKNNEKYPRLFNRPIMFDPRGRTFTLVVKTRDGL